MKNSGDLNTKTYWLAIWSLFLGVTGLVGAEFLPISLLTPIAADLRISEGAAGQTITAVGLFAVVTSLLLVPLTQKSDRRFVLLVFSALLVISNALVALTPNFVILLAARALLGICVGGFWSLAAAMVLRLAEPHHVPRALSFVYAGVSTATILAVPFAAWAGQFIGWCGVFACSCLLGLLTFFFQYRTLPSLPVAGDRGNFTAAAELLQKSWVVLGLLAVMCSYGGYYILFTYMRPFFEQNLFLHGNGLSLALLAFSLANCIGTFIAGFLLARFFTSTMLTGHALLACVALALLFMNKTGGINIVFFMIWGGVFGIITVGWSAWIIRTLPEKAELAGGLIVAAIQSSIMLGSAFGGILFDYSGINSLFYASFFFLCHALILIYISFKIFRRIEKRFI